MDVTSIGFVHDQFRVAMVKELDAEVFKDQCLPLLDRLDADGLIITKNGKPVAKITPYETGCEIQGRDLIGSLRHKITIKGDLFSTGLRWESDAPS